MVAASGSRRAQELGASPLSNDLCNQPQQLLTQWGFWDPVIDSLIRYNVRTVDLNSCLMQEFVLLRHRSLELWGLWRPQEVGFRTEVDYWMLSWSLKSWRPGQVGETHLFTFRVSEHFLNSSGTSRCPMRAQPFQLAFRNACCGYSQKNWAGESTAPGDSRLRLEEA